MRQEVPGCPREMQRGSLKPLTARVLLVLVVFAAGGRGTAAGNGKLYFFKGDQYWRFNGYAQKADVGYPKSIASSWHGVPNNIDGVFTWSNGKTYFFKGYQYWRYNDEEDRVDSEYPLSIRDHWPGMPTSIDAVYRHLAGSTFFFKGRFHWKFNDILGTAERGYPREIFPHWMQAPNDVDGVFRWPGSQYTIFVKGDQFWLLDPKYKVAQRRNMTDWEGIPDNVDAAFVWGEVSRT